MEPYATAAGWLRTWMIIVNATSVETETQPDWRRVKPLPRTGSGFMNLLQIAWRL